MLMAMMTRKILPIGILMPDHYFGARCGGASIPRLRPKIPDVRIVILPHGRRVQETVPRRLRHAAIVRIGGFHLDDHGPVRRVVADPVDEAASGDVLADERGEVDGAAMVDGDGFSVGPAGAGQAGEKYRQISKGHATPILPAPV